MNKVPQRQTRSLLIKAAQREVRKMQRPEGVTTRHWLYVQQVLFALCRHVPDVHPSQATLAAESGLPRRTVQRTLNTAERVGLIERNWRWHGHWASHGYQLLWLKQNPPPRRHIDATTWRHIDAPSSTPNGLEVKAESSNDDRPPPSKPSDSRRKKNLSKRPTPRLLNLYGAGCVKCQRPVPEGAGFRGSPGYSPLCWECGNGLDSTYSGDPKLEAMLEWSHINAKNHDAYVPPEVRDSGVTRKRVIPRTVTAEGTD